jgi:DNA-directed RNA polymerase sigma subunit (sigma70/sigma32)
MCAFRPAQFFRQGRIGGEEDSHPGDFIKDKNAILPIGAAIQSNARETAARVLASLTPREERVLRMRFGIGMNTDHTLEEVRSILRWGQWEKRATATFRSPPIA